MNIFSKLKTAHQSAKSSRTDRDTQELQSKPFLKLRYYRELGSTIASFLKSLMNAALSLVSGTVALVSGYYEIRRIIISNQHNLKKMRAGEEDQFRSSGIGHGHGLSVKHHKETATAKPVSTPEPMMASSGTVLETGAIDLSEKMGYHMETTSWTLLISILVFLALRIPALFKKGEGDEQESKAKHPSKHSHN